MGDPLSISPGRPQSNFSISQQQDKGTTSANTSRLSIPPSSEEQRTSMEAILQKKDQMITDVIHEMRETKPKNP